MNRIRISLYFFAAALVWMSVAPAQAIVQQQSVATNLGLYGGSIWDMAIDQTNNILYATANNTPNGFFYSTDAGDNWNGMAAGSDYGVIMGVEIDPTTNTVFAAFNDTLYRSIDHGATFQDIADISAGQLLFADGQLYALSEGATLNISSDDGDSFTTSAIANNFAAWDITASAANGDLYVLGNNSGENNPILYHSTDQGVSWTNVHTFTDISDSTSSADIAADPNDALHLVLAAGFDDLAQQSYDGGTTWEEISDIYAINTTFDVTGRAYLGSYYSDDAGATWTAITDQSIRLPEHNLMIDPSDPTILYGDGQVGLLKSTDRGVTWASFNQGLAGVMVTDIAQATNNDVVWTASYNGFAKTVNFTSDAPTWQFPMLGEAGVSVWLDPANPDTVLAGGICFLYKSTDGGTTWGNNILWGTVSCDEQVADIVADPTDSTILYAAVANNNPNRDKSGMVLRSTDQGDTWTDLQVPDGVSVQTLAMNQAGDLFAGVGATAGTAVGVGLRMYNIDGWADITSVPSEEIRKIIIDPNDDLVMYALAGIHDSADDGGFGVYKTIDGGVTWTKQTADLGLRTFDTITLQNSSTLYLAGTDSNSVAVIYKSSDAGATWGQYYAGLSGDHYYALLFDGLAAGNDRGLYRLQSKPHLTLHVNQSKKSSVTVAVNDTISLRSQLTDMATGKLLKYQKVKIYRKTNTGSWELFKRKTTNQHGRITIHTTLQHSTHFKIRWTPPAQKSEEYTSGASRVVTVTVAN